MKRSRQRRSERGYSLITAAVAAGVLGILVVGYLSWVTNEYILSQRSHRWTEALDVCEAGAELGMAELNAYYRYDTSTAFLNSRGWSSIGANAYSRTVTNLTDSTGRTVGSVVVTVTGANDLYPVIQAVSTVTPGGLTPHTITCGLRVVTQRKSSFRYGFAARRYFELSSNTAITMDSFDSSDPNKSTNGQYDATKRGTSGNIACLATNANSIRLQNATAYGAANTAAGGHVTFDSGSSIGATFNAVERANNEPSAETFEWVKHDFILLMPNVALPPALPVAPNLGDISGNTTLTSGDYRVGDFKNNKGNITISGKVRLYVTGKVALAGQNYLEVTSGSSLEVYVAGDLTITGGGVINHNGVADKNSWWGLPSSTSWSLSGNAEFIGTAYAPQATLNLGGNSDFMGAFVGDQILAGGNGGVHYDEDLGRGMSILVYKMASWQPLVYRNGSWVLETN
jgi:hypothetical protein